PQSGGRLPLGWRPGGIVRLLVLVGAGPFQRAAGPRRLIARSVPSGRPTPRVVRRVRNCARALSGLDKRSVPAVEATLMQGQTSARTPRNIEHAVVRFAGDS